MGKASTRSSVCGQNDDISGDSCCFYLQLSVACAMTKLFVPSIGCSVNATIISTCDRNGQFIGAICRAVCWREEAYQLKRYGGGRSMEYFSMASILYQHLFIFLYMWVMFHCSVTPGKILHEDCSLCISDEQMFLIGTGNCRRHYLLFCMGVVKLSVHGR